MYMVYMSTMMQVNHNKLSKPKKRFITLVHNIGDARFMPFS